MLNLTSYPNLLLTNIERSAQALLPADIVRLTMTKANLEAVNEWRRVIDTVYEQSGYGTLLTLTDARRGGLDPMGFMTHFSDLWCRHAHRRLYSRNAVLCAAALPQGAEAVLQALPGYGSNTVRFFAVHERDRAVRWLLSDD